MTKVIVPKNDLEEIEKARKNLYKLLEKHIQMDSVFLTELLAITQLLWKVGNTRYPEIPSINTELSWYPKLIDDAYIQEIRKNYPEETEVMSNEEIHDKYANGAKYESLWDNTREAYYDYEKLADAYLQLIKTE